jgi:hypothetical protein
MLMRTLLVAGVLQTPIMLVTFSLKLALSFAIQTVE